MDLLAVQGTLKSLLQHHSSKASILRCSAFLIVQLSHPYMTTGKIIALTRRTFVGKVMFLLFKMLSRLVIAFLPRSKCLIMSWLQSPSAVILEPEKLKSVTVSIVSPSICHEVMDQISSLVGSKYIFLTQYVSKFGKPSSSHRTAKGQFSFQSQRKAMPENAQRMLHYTTATQFKMNGWVK